jgi:hypothetical protein
MILLLPLPCVLVLLAAILMEAYRGVPLPCQPVATTVHAGSLP